MVKTREVAEGPVSTTLRIVGGIPDLQVEQENDSATDKNAAQEQAPLRATG
jgi:hypothetical protein